MLGQKDPIVVLPSTDRDGDRQIEMRIDGAGNFGEPLDRPVAKF